MGLIAQYCETFRKDGKLSVRFAVYEEAKPLPKETVVVDATDCESLSDVESLAFSKKNSSDAHPLFGELKAACLEGRVAKQSDAKPLPASNPPEQEKPAATLQPAPPAGGK